MSDPQALPSWDVERERAPERPAFASSLPEQKMLPRPKRAVVAFVLVALAVIGFGFSIAMTLAQLEEVRDALIAAVPGDMREDYAEADLRGAADAALGAALGVGALVMLILILSARSMTFGRRPAARGVLIVAAVLSLPATLIALLVRDAGSIDIALSAAGAVCVIVAVACSCTPVVSRWLRQREPARSIPLAPPAGESRSDQP